MGHQGAKPSDTTYNSSFWKQAFGNEDRGANNVRHKLAAYRDTQPMLEDQLLATYPTRKRSDMTENQSRKWHHHHNRELPPKMTCQRGPRGTPDMTMYQPPVETKPGAAGIMPDKQRGSSMLWPTRFLKGRATHSWRTYCGDVNHVRTRNRFVTSNNIDFNQTNSIGAYTTDARMNDRYPMPSNTALLTQFGNEPVALPGDRPTKRLFKHLPRLRNKLAGPAAS